MLDPVENLGESVVFFYFLLCLFRFFFFFFSVFKKPRRSWSTGRLNINPKIRCMTL